jgi:rare lipoprotein A (peptidoglycan hydrolase)
VLYQLSYVGEGGHRSAVAEEIRTAPRRSTPVLRRRRALIGVALAALVAGAVVGALSHGKRWRTVVVSTYGSPGDSLACGGRLAAGQQGVAHRTLPCGTKVELRREGRTLTTRVIDRGPYVAGRTFDLTGPAASQLGIGDGLARIEWRRP